MWTTWSPTRVCDLFCVRMHTHGGPRFIFSSVGLWAFCWRLDFSVLLTAWLWSLQDERRGQATRTWEEEEGKKLTVLFCRHRLTLQSRGTAVLVTVIWRTHLNWHLFSFSSGQWVSYCGTGHWHWHYPEWLMLTWKDFSHHQCCYDSFISVNDWL